MARIIILAARNWELRDKETGEVRSGIKLDGCEGFQNDEPNYRGRGAVELQASPKAWDTLRSAELPAICDVDLGTRKARNKSGAAVAVASVEEVYSVHPIDFNVAGRKAA